MAHTDGSLHELVAPLAALREVQSLVARIQQHGYAGVSGAPRSAASALAAVLQEFGGGESTSQLLVVTANPEAASSWADELRQWLPAQVESMLFPPLEALPYERAASEPTVVRQRQRVLQALVRGHTIAVVAPVRSLLQPLMEAARFRDLLRTYKVGGRLLANQEETIWLSMGYAKVPVVQAPGQYSRRGGIVDIYPAGGTWPVRIELVGSEIDSLRHFDPATQRSTGAVEAETVAPVQPFVLPAPASSIEMLRGLDCSRCLPHIQTQWAEELAALGSGVAFEGIEFYTPYLLDPASSLLAYLPGTAILFLDEPEACLAAINELTEQANELERELVGRGEVPPGLRSPLLDRATVWSDVESISRLEWHTRVGADRADWSAGNVFRSAPSYAGSLKRFVQDCDELRKQQERVVIVSLQSQRLADLLREGEVPVQELQGLDSLPERGSLTAVPGLLPEGWYAPNAHLMVFTDTEVAGWNRPRRPAARFHREAGNSFALDYTPGDYVVHIEHGIGRFQGVVRMGSGKAEREYLDLQFAGTDRLYVPTDQLDRVTKYQSLGETAPTLSRLGTQEWVRAKAKVKESVEAVARELLELYQFREKAEGFAFPPDGHWQRELEASFPYDETTDQEQAIRDVKGDMERLRPMDRLVCGDVGYGKTEVALRAAFKAAVDGKQVAVLVPTTILAQQHFNTFRERMQAFPVKIGVLSRFHSRAEQVKVIEGVRNGDVDIVIGTHRLLQKDVNFKDLGLLIIDEEQRFGVKHKEQLKRMRQTIDVLTLSATPIPRSLHMALIEIRDLSVIATPPEGRLPIKTFLEPFDEYHIREAILREIDRGGQIYFVHNRVQTIHAITARLQQLVPNARIAIAHGQLPEDDLERIMFEFADGLYDVLVCSTIIENGLDIPNVNTMIVNEAPQFGLSQLYQLRGRIGRSGRRGYAYLLYSPGARISGTAQQRLKAIFESTELGAGFQIAMKDLEIRGAGNVLGSAQHGQMVAVGFQLYCAMLLEAVDRQRRGTLPKTEVPLSAAVSVPADAFLPADYVEDENQRLRLYQRLAAAANVAQVDDLAVEIRDRFGPLPEPVQSMLTTVRIRLKATRLAISHVTLEPLALVMRGSPTATVYDRMDIYTRYGATARIDRGNLRIPIARISAKPLQDVESILDRALEAASQPLGPGARELASADRARRGA